MKTFKDMLIRTIGLIAIVVIGLLVLLALSNEEGAARSTLAGLNVTALSPAGESMLASVSDSSGAGVFRSTDGGRTWEMASRELERPVNALAVSAADGKTAYAGTDGGSLALERDSLFVSHDAGRTWSRPALMLPASPEGRLPNVVALAVDPSDPGTVYVGTETQGLYKLTDGGTTMTALGADFYRARVDEVVVSKADSNRVYAVTSQGVFASLDGGEDWERLESMPEQALTLAVGSTSSQVIYAGTVSMGAYRSPDGGRTWESISSGLGLVPGVTLAVRRIEVDERDDAHLFAAPAYVFPGSDARAVALGIYESRDAGETWTLARAPDGTSEVNDLALNSRQDEVYAATDRGVVHTGREGERTSLLDPLGDLFAGGDTHGNALARVSIILFTAMAGITVWIIKPVHFCGTFLRRMVHRSCDL